MLSSKIRNDLVAYVRSLSGITLDEMLRPETLRRFDGATSDDIFTLIARGDVYVNLSEESLAEPELVHLYPDRDTGYVV